MRIAVVTETFPPEINGVALTVQSFVEHLAALGHEIVLTRPRQPAADAHPPAPRVTETLVRGAALPRYPGLRFGLPSGRHLRRLWQAQRPDAVYIATEGPLGWSAVRAANALGIPSATGFHTRFDDFVGHYGLGILTPMVFGFLRRFHNLSGATLVPTRELEGFLRDAGFRSVRRLERAVDTRQFSPVRRDPALRAAWGLGENDLAVIYVGRIAPEKNLELAVRTFAAIRAARPGARFVWVGDGPARAALEREHPEFLFLGMRRGEELARHFASADLFLFPSRTETFGNVTLESLASGVPLVAFDYGAAREHVRDGLEGRVAPLGDADAFVAAATALATDRDALCAMRTRARARVERLDPVTVARDLAALLADLPQPQRRAA